MTDTLLNKLTNQTISLVVLAITLYSALAEDKDIIGYSLDLHVMGAWSRNVMNPMIECLVEGHEL